MANFHYRVLQQTHRKSHASSHAQSDSSYIHSGSTVVRSWLCHGGTYDVILCPAMNGHRTYNVDCFLWREKQNNTIIIAPYTRTTQRQMMVCVVFTPLGAEMTYNSRTHLLPKHTHNVNISHAKFTHADCRYLKVL